MAFFGQSSGKSVFRPDAGPALDPRLIPTPDYGTLGPGSDISASKSGPPRPGSSRPSLQWAHLLAVAIGMSAALIAGAIGKTHSGRPGLEKRAASPPSEPASLKDLNELDRMQPQRQAETLLELAVNNSDDAVKQIATRVDGWQGKVQWNSQIASLSTAALNSSDMRVRESGVEVELAAYGLGKNSASLDYVLNMTRSPDHAQKIWALWALGLMANRGVEAGRVVETLATHLIDSDADSRRWAVEALALSGTDQALGVLLKTMHDDESPLVRERAACGLAESGLFTPEQRLTVVPQLLNYTDDPSLDAQTHAWAFHALRDITHQQLPNDSAAWRSWYER